MKIKIMKILLIIPVLLLSITLFAQVNQTDQQGKRQGLWKKEYPGGRLMYEGYFNDGEPTGSWKRYHENGQLKAAIDYDEDSDSATVVLYNTLGQKIASGKYVDEKKAGNWKYFSGERIVAGENFSDGQKHGQSIRYYESGEPFEISEWVNGKQEGKYQVLFKNGKPAMQCKMSNNMRNGLCLSYFENGRVEMEASYFNNLRDGEWKFYNQDGDHLYTLIYDKGKILNPEVRDSIDNLQLKNMESAPNAIPDPEKFMQDPTEYMRKMNQER